MTDNKTNEDKKKYVYIGKYGYYNTPWRMICVCSTFEKAKARMEIFARNQKTDFNTHDKVWVGEINWELLPAHSSYVTPYGKKQFDKMTIHREEVDKGIAS